MKYKPTSDRTIQVTMTARDVYLILEALAESIEDRREMYAMKAWGNPRVSRDCEDMLKMRGLLEQAEQKHLITH